MLGTVSAAGQPIRNREGFFVNAGTGIASGGNPFKGPHKNLWVT
jgi:hypothetical protein